MPVVLYYINTVHHIHLLWVFFNNIIIITIITIYHHHRRRHRRRCRHDLYINLSFLKYVVPQLYSSQKRFTMIMYF